MVEMTDPVEPTRHQRQVIAMKVRVMIVGMILCVGLIALVAALSPPRPPMATVIVAKSDYPQATSINEPREMFLYVQHPVHLVPANALRHYDQLRDRPTRREIRAGQIVVTDDIELDSAYSQAK